MSTNVLQTPGTAIVLADATDHNPGASAQNNLGTRTDQIDMTSLAAGSYRQSDKFDLSDPHAMRWAVTGAFEPTSAPDGTSSVRLWIGFSRSSTAGQDNPANLSGSDSAYNGYGAAAADADECINQLLYLGERQLSADADIQVCHFNTFSPQARYAIIVVQNDLNVNFAADAIEMSIRLVPIIDQIQA